MRFLPRAGGVADSKPSSPLPSSPPPPVVATSKFYEAIIESGPVMVLQIGLYMFIVHPSSAVFLNISMMLSVLGAAHEFANIYRKLWPASRGWLYYSLVELYMMCSVAAHGFAFGILIHFVNDEMRTRFKTADEDQSFIVSYLIILVGAGFVAYVFNIMLARCYMQSVKSAVSQTAVNIFAALPALQGNGWMQTGLVSYTAVLGCVTGVVCIAITISVDKPREVKSKSDSAGNTRIRYHLIDGCMALACGVTQAVLYVFLMRLQNRPRPSQTSRDRMHPPHASRRSTSRALRRVGALVAFVVEIAFALAALTVLRGGSLKEIVCDSFGSSFLPAVSDASAIQQWQIYAGCIIPFFGNVRDVDALYVNDPSSSQQARRSDSILTDLTLPGRLESVLLLQLTCTTLKTLTLPAGFKSLGSAITNYGSPLTLLRLPPAIQTRSFGLKTVCSTTNCTGTASTPINAAVYLGPALTCKVCSDTCALCCCVP
eukprot:m.117948 g.117948  ORF g.117948 m.117948 type:complete len:486 (-) comp9218_c1_seq1:1070-2527(-)